MADPNVTLNQDGQEVDRPSGELFSQYRDIVQRGLLNWTSHLRLKKRLGAGGQGVVYLTELRGADEFTLPIALKIFSPERYKDSRAYEESMQRIAHVSALVAQIQHDNLLDVHNFVDRNQIRMMVMEWVDGYDLQCLLAPGMLARIKGRVSERRWDYINRVIVTNGPVHPKVKPGVAVAIVRDCLAALAALHREEIVHGDVKPSNIMLKRTGSAKIVDIGSAFELDNPPASRTCTPAYAAPEVLEGAECTPRSDLASLGYVLLELMSGRPLFSGLSSCRELLEAKRLLPQRLNEILPQEITVNNLLMNFCRGLIAPDPMRRFPSAEAADMLKEGAAAFHRQLVISDLASEYGNEIRLWLEELKELDESQTRDFSL
jgi:serine/threonine-protein kinase